METFVSPFDVEAAQVSLYEWDNQEAVEHS
jgi:hypothetical protein